MKIVFDGVQDRAALFLLMGAGVRNVVLPYTLLQRRKDEGMELLKAAKDAGMWVLISPGAEILRTRYRWLDLTEVDRSGKVLPGKRVPQRKVNASRMKAGDIPRAEAVARLDGYFHGYMVWLERFSAYFHAYGELDLDMIVEGKIWEWRETMGWRMAGSGCSMIVTPHLYKTWDSLLDGKYTYVGLSGASDQDLSAHTRFFASHLETLRLQGILVHGWGMARNKAVSGLPLYSTNTTAWTSGGSWGNTYRYTGGRKISVWSRDKKDIRRTLATECKAAAVSHALLVRGDRHTVNSFNAYQWRLFAEAMEKDTGRAYWLSDAQKVEDVQEAREEALVPVLSTQLASATKPAHMFRQCSACFLSSQCPAYKPDSPCTVAERVDIREAEGFRDAVFSVLEAQLERVMFGAQAEKISGVVMDAEVSKGMAATMAMFKQARDIFDPRDEVFIKAKGAAAKGLVAKLFSGYGRAGQSPPSDREQDPEPTIDVTPIHGGS